MASTIRHVSVSESLAPGSGITGCRLMNTFDGLALIEVNGKMYAPTMSSKIGIAGQDVLGQVDFTGMRVVVLFDPSKLPNEIRFDPPVSGTVKVYGYKHITENTSQDARIPTPATTIETFFADGRRFTYPLKHKPVYADSVYVNGQRIGFSVDGTAPLDDTLAADISCDSQTIQFLHCHKRGTEITVEYSY